ncbi:hypothetical protein [Amycolatopsis thermoflava]|uniref:hypothetical protein n=1 Tax=Amycolatopsis thermoflava TaxID=84480 RepID=UPI000483C8B7|nr:hypothetical protein [Amycolatopsis thermoflava]
MSDPIGTIRREDHYHGDGYSIWARIHHADYRRNEEWTCVWSTAEGNVGERLRAAVIEVAEVPVVGAIPGTPAASAKPPVFSPYPDEEARLRWETLRAARAVSEEREVGSIPVVVGNLLAMYEADCSLSVSVTEEKR